MNPAPVPQRLFDQRLDARFTAPPRWSERVLEAGTLALAAVVIYLVASRRHVDLADEGFYYASAWFAYSPGGPTPVGALLMNFGYVIGWPYWFATHPPILAFRISSLAGWFAVHAWFFVVVIRALRFQVPRWIPQLVALASLAIFLIPTLSYQNLPYLFVLMASTLMLSAYNHPERTTFAWAAIGVAMALAIVASTIFVTIAPLVMLLLTAVWLRERPLPWFGCGIGTMIGVVVLLTVFDPSAFRAWSPTTAFLTNELDYSSADRIIVRLIALTLFLAPGLVLGAIVWALAFALRHHFNQERMLIGLASLGIALLLAHATWTPCVITCDEVHEDWINAAVIASLTLMALLLRRGWWAGPVIASLLLCGGTAIFYAVVSNAPFHYNLKFAVPAIAGVWLLILADAVPHWPRSQRVLPALAAIALWGTALRILLLAHYGGEPPWQSTARMDGPLFRGLYATPERAEMLLKMQAAYQEHGCASRHFAAVDSLVLPYVLFERRPPFPHAWVGERVAVSRAIVARLPRACVMMQDRILPHTPKDSETMAGYLRLGPQDHVDIVSLGLNVFLVVFTRASSA